VPSTELHPRVSAASGPGLRLQINVIVGVLTLLFVAAMLWMQVHHARDSVREEVVAANRVAAQLLDRTVWRYAAQGQAAMLNFLQGMGRVRSNDISLVDGAGQVLYTSPPSPYKAGRDAPEWFAQLVQPPLSETAIAFPDGKLLVRANASRAVLDAWDDLVWLLQVAGVLLLVVNLGVYLLVGRTVRPFASIVAALNQVQEGRFGTALPALPGREAGAIGAAFNRMVGELQRHIETERRAVRAEMQLSDSRELTRWIEQHIEDERKLIARELHDELGQSVTAIRSMALSIASRTQGRDAEAEAAARLIAEESSRLYDAMHGIIPRLSPLVLDRFGLAEALADLAERTRRSQGIDVQVQVDLAALGEAPLQPDTALAVYRAAQEGMSNALRHGHATRLQLAVQVQGSDLLLELADNGAGLPAGGVPPGAGHHGVRWMAERAQALGGHFELLARAAGGTLLRLQLPVAAQVTTQGAA
jgi:two-component system sensor histidine kinase UhpB